ncbi:hypothetical protein, partial [Streptomyces sp. NPDC058451]|uniref:hypothetical protein n=1 Tax=Streptomyces sp. NPDC058451 TaxID=3346506 RepID=UPI0036518C2C
MDKVHEGDSEHLSASVHVDKIEHGEASPDKSETKAGQTGSKVLIKSEPPERETRERKPGKHRGNRIGKRSDRVGNTEGKP